MTSVEYMRGDIKNVDLLLEGNKSALESFRGVGRPYPSPHMKELDVTKD